MIFTSRYMCILKYVRLTHVIRNMLFIIPWKALYLHVHTTAHVLSFSRYERLTPFWKRMFKKIPVLRTLINVRKTCVYESTLNIRYMIRLFTMR